MLRLAAVAATVAACVGVVLAAQSPATPQETPLFRAGVDVVQLDVSVLDKNRRPVTGLTQADFTVLENGRPQPVVAFSPVDIPGAPDVVVGDAPWLRAVAPDVSSNDAGTRRIVVIVLDDAFMPTDPAVMKYAKQIARSVVDQLGPSDLAAVAYTLIGRNQDITTDHQRLLGAIDGLVGHQDSHAPSSFSAARGSAMPLMSPQTNRGLSQGSPCSFRGPYQGQAACVIDTLVTAADALATGPSGRKTLVYISTGVPYDFSMDNPEASDDLNGIQHLFARLQQANVTVYAVDPSGLTMEGIIGPRLDALRVFAEATGGRATIATNAPWDAVPQIFRENSSYYLLGFRSTNPAADGRFRRIDVKVSRPDVDVRARSGYYAPKPDTRRRASSSVSPTEKALSGGLPGGDLTLAVTAAPFATADRSRPTVVVTTGFRSLPISESRTVDLLASAVDYDAKVRGTVHQTVELRLAAARDGDSYHDVISRLPLSPGRYQLRVAATAGGNTGSVFADVEVPDFSRNALSVSGLLLGTEDRGDRPRSPLADLGPVVPTTSRDFSPTAPVAAFLRIYQGGSKAPGAVRVNTTITDDRNRTNVDQTMFFESARFAGTRAVDYRFDLPLSTLEAGPHLLTIEAVLGRTSVSRQARFIVR